MNSSTSLLIALLRRKQIYDDTVWSFSIKHGDFDTFIEFINNSDSYSLANSLSGEEVLYINTPIIQVDKFTFKEYNPLINPRVHDIGEFKHNILNRDFKATYLTFLKYLFQKTFLTLKTIPTSAHTCFSKTESMTACPCSFTSSQRRLKSI
jgi:hypothetical protein